MVIGVGQGGVNVVFTQYLLSARPTPDVAPPMT